MDDYLIKDAAQIIGLNYSTAKSIVKRFREKKSFKKKLIKLSQKQNKITHQGNFLITMQNFHLKLKEKMEVMSIY